MASRLLQECGSIQRGVQNMVMMKRVFCTVLANSTLALGLLLGANLVEAADDQLDGNGNVHRINPAILGFILDSDARLDPDTVCGMALCADDDTLAQECQEFVDECRLTADPEACAAGGLFTCEGKELPPGVGQENVCDENQCRLNDNQRQRCLVFLGACLGSNLTEKCVAGALWVCTNPIQNKPGL